MHCFQVVEHMHCYQLESFCFETRWCTAFNYLHSIWFRCSTKIMFSTWRFFVQSGTQRDSDNFTLKRCTQIEAKSSDNLSEQTRQEWMLANIESNRCNAAITTDLLTPSIAYLKGLEPFSDWDAPTSLRTQKTVTKTFGDSWLPSTEKNAYLPWS